MARIKKLFGKDTKNNRSRFSRLEELEGRFLLAVSAGAEVPVECAPAAAVFDAPVSETVPVQIEEAHSEGIEIGDPLPTMTITITGYSDYYDGEYHTVTLDGTEEGDKIAYSEEGVLYYDSPISYKDAGNYSVYVRVERSGYQTWYGSAAVKITKKQIVVTGTVVQNKPYDGTTTAEVQIGRVSGIAEPDEGIVTVSATGTFPSSAIGSYTNVKVVYKVNGEGASNYIVSPSFEYKSAEITDGVVSKIAAAVVLSDSLSSVNKLNDLPKSISEAEVGDTIYAQIWIKNTDGSLDSCVGGYVDLLFDGTILTGKTYTVSTLFPEMATYTAYADGRVSAAGGMSSAGDKTLAVTQWALLGTVSFTVTAAGTTDVQTTTPTMNGVTMEAMNLSRIGKGAFKSSEIDFRSASITVTGSASQLDPPSIINSKKAEKYFISYGANRHQLFWSEVENASEYEVAYSGDGGKTWKTLRTADTSAVITGLTYGKLEEYKVRAIGSGLYSDSEWSAVKSFYVCPIDIDGDGEIAGSDMAFLKNAWHSEEGDDNYTYYADIDGDGNIAGSDFAFLSGNWHCEVEEDAETMKYPKPLNLDAGFGDDLFFSLDEDFDIFG